MNKLTIKWLLFLLCVLLSASIACSCTNQFTEWRRDDVDSENTVCDDGLVIDYEIFCDNNASPKVNNFSGKIFNNTDKYAHDVTFVVELHSGPPPISCSFQFDEIAPGATVEALCQRTANVCLDSGFFTDDSCKFVTYPEHLDFLATQDNKESQGPEAEEIPNDPPDTFVLTGEHIEQLYWKWHGSFEEFPCQPDAAKQAFDTWLQNQAGAWAAEAGDIIGEGKPWLTIEDFQLWLKIKMGFNEDAPIKRTWKGDFNLITTRLDPCYTCTTPSLDGTISLTVDLKTCFVTGEIGAGGEGDVTINDCINNVPTDDICTSHGMLTFSGDFSGTVDTSGQLDLVPSPAKFDESTQWTGGCEWDDQGVKVNSWEDPVTITGSLDFQGAASGSIKYSTSVCSFEGTWTIDSGALD